MSFNILTNDVNFFSTPTYCPFYSAYSHKSSTVSKSSGIVTH